MCMCAHYAKKSCLIPTVNYQRKAEVSAQSSQACSQVLTATHTVVTLIMFDFIIFLNHCCKEGPTGDPLNIVSYLKDIEKEVSGGHMSSHLQIFQSRTV